MKNKRLTCITGRTFTSKAVDGMNRSEQHGGRSDEGLRTTKLDVEDAVLKVVTEFTDTDVILERQHLKTWKESGCNTCITFTNSIYLFIYQYLMFLSTEYFLILITFSIIYNICKQQSVQMIRSMFILRI